jgi:tetratricopeptide (TPR) repeat protein
MRIIAIGDYDQAIRLDQNNAAAFNNRGNVTRRRERLYDRAIADYSEAIRLTPDNGATFSSRAYAFRFVGQYDRAASRLPKALTLNIDAATRKQVETALKQLGAS